MFSGWGFILHTFTVSSRQEGRSQAGAGGLASPGQPGAHARCSGVWLFSQCSLCRDQAGLSPAGEGRGEGNSLWDINSCPCWEGMGAAATSCMGIRDPLASIKGPPEHWESWCFMEKGWRLNIQC